MLAVVYLIHVFITFTLHTYFYLPTHQHILQSIKAFIQRMRLFIQYHSYGATIMTSSSLLKLLCRCTDRGHYVSPVAGAVFTGSCFVRARWKGDEEGWMRFIEWLDHGTSRLVLALDAHILLCFDCNRS